VLYVAIILGSDCLWKCDLAIVLEVRNKSDVILSKADELLTLLKHSPQER